MTLHAQASPRSKRAITKPRGYWAGLARRFRDAIEPMADYQQKLREYLATPPSGIDPRIWKQAQAENPDPENFIPVPLVGFGELVRHLHLQVKLSASYMGHNIFTFLCH